MIPDIQPGQKMGMKVTLVSNRETGSKWWPMEKMRHQPNRTRKEKHEGLRRGMSAGI